MHELNVGDLVEAVAGHHLACGSGIYPHAVVVSLEPFALASVAGDMLWTATHNCGTVRRIGPAPDTKAAFARWERERGGRRPSAFGDYSIGSDKWPGLSKLIEEMGETGQVAGKLIATNGKTDHWDGSDLRQRLTEELADLAAAITFFTQLNGLDTEEFHSRRIQKVRTFNTWHNEQQAATE